MLLFGVCSLSMMLNLFFIFLNVTQRIGAWYEAQTGKDLQYGSRTLYLVSATCQSLIVLLFCNLEHEQFFRDHKFLRSSIHEGILAAKVFGLFVINIGTSQNKPIRVIISRLEFKLDRFHYFEMKKWYFQSTWRHLTTLQSNQNGTRPLLYSEDHFRRFSFGHKI